MLGLKGAKQEVQANVLNGKCRIGGYTCSNELRIVGWQHKHQDSQQIVLHETLEH